MKWTSPSTQSLGLLVILVSEALETRSWQTSPPEARFLIHGGQRSFLPRRRTDLCPRQERFKKKRIRQPGITSPMQLPHREPSFGPRPRSPTCLAAED